MGHPQTKPGALPPAAVPRAGIWPPRVDVEHAGCRPMRRPRFRGGGQPASAGGALAYGAGDNALAGSHARQPRGPRRVVSKLRESSGISIAQGILVV